MMKIAVVALAVLGCVLAQGQNELPPFLVGAAPAVVKSFQALFQGADNLSAAAVDAKVATWAKTQDAALQAKFNEASAKQKDLDAKFEAERQAKFVSKLSPAAQAADAKLYAVSKNPSLKPQEVDAQIAAIMKSLPPAVQKELQASG